jgi:hypothetical protein
VRRQGAEEPHWEAESAASLRARSDQAIRVLIPRVFLWSGCVGQRWQRIQKPANPRIPAPLGADLGLGLYPRARV